jgi:glycosyltransferase involved in cell wall biosynthesis
MDYAGISNNDKFIAIPNALSYDEFLPIENIQNKKKQALIVSRLVETPKRISYAIKAWAEIEKDARFNNWGFKIVGSGPAEDSYKALTQRLGIKRIEFCGRQQPKSYYEESSLFLMTSSYEGWGLTLTEAQQFGCVPIAFDSYSSIHDIITNGENGFLIENNNIQLFTEKLKLLMKDKKMLNNMAKDAISSSHRFELETIIYLWIKLLETNK